MSESSLTTLITSVPIFPNLNHILFGFQNRVAFSGNYEIVAISTDKTTIFNDLDYKADIGQHFHKSEKSARWRHRHKIIKTNLKTHISPLLTRPQGSQGCQKMRQDPLNMPVEVWCAKIAPKLKNI